MTTPADRLERFERQHGDWYELLAQLTGDPKRDRDTNALMRQHHTLVVAVVAYQQGYQDAARIAKNGGTP